MSYGSSSLEALHKRSIRHRAVVQAAPRSGCFYCGATFLPAEITDWVDGGDVTALCPKCGIDSVLPDHTSQPLSPASTMPCTPTGSSALSKCH